MIIPNLNYANLKNSYLFAGIAQRLREYQTKHPEEHLYRMGIGDVSLPLCGAVIRALHEAVEEQAVKESFHGMGGEIPETTKKKIDAMHRRSEHKRSGIKKY